MAPDHESRPQTPAGDGSSSSSSSSSGGVKSLASSDAACLNAAIALYKETGASQFLKLAQDATGPGRNMAITRGREANERIAAAMKTIRNLFETGGDALGLEGAKEAVEACQTLWPDGAFNKLDHEVVLTLANSTSRTKSLIPSSHFRIFIGIFSELAKQKQEYRIGEHRESEFLEEVHQMIKEAFDITNAASRSSGDPESRPLGAVEYEQGKKLSTRIMEQIKLISDSIATDADKIIESEKQALQNLESLVSGLCSSDGGSDTSNVFREVYEISILHSCESIEAIKAKVQAMSRFLEGSIKILQESD